MKSAGIHRAITNVDAGKTNRTRGFIAAILAGLLALAGLSSFSTAANAVDLITISGTIVTPSGESLDGVHVDAYTVGVLHGAGHSTVAADGSFSFGNLPDGVAYQLRVGNYFYSESPILSGWVTSDGTVSQDRNEATTFTGAQSDVVINATLGQSITGTLVAEPGSTVDFSKFTMEYVSDTSIWLGDVAADGTFQYPGLWPGSQYRIFVRSSAEEPYLLGYLGADGELVSYSGDASPVLAGTSGLVIPVEMGMSLSGTLSLPTVVAPEEIQLWAGILEGDEVSSSEYIPVDEDGNFESDPLKFGQYVIEFRHTGDEPNPVLTLLGGYLGADGSVVRTVSEAQVFSATANDLVITPAPSQMIAGTMNFPEGWSGDPRVFALRAIDEDASWLTADVKADGSFEIRGLWPTRQYRITVDSSGPEAFGLLVGYVGANSEIVQFEEQSVAVEPGSVLSLDMEYGASISGQVVTPDDWTGDITEIEVLAQDDSDSGYIWTTPAADGSFTVGGSWPGTVYTLYVYSEFQGAERLASGFVAADGTLTSDPASAHGFLGGTEGLQIIVDRGVNLEFNLLPPAGWVGDLSTWVEVFPANGIFFTSTSAEADGSISVQALPNGNYRIMVGPIWNSDQSLVGGYLKSDGTLTQNIAEADLFSAGSSVPDAQLNLGYPLTVTAKDASGAPVDLYQYEVLFTRVGSDSDSDAYDYDDNKVYSYPYVAGTKLIITLLDWDDDGKPYYVTADRKLTTDKAKAGQFTLPRGELVVTMELASDAPPKPTDPKPKPKPVPVHKFAQVVPSPDLTGDGYGDLLAVDHDGVLWLYRGSATGSLSSPAKIGGGWGGFIISAPGDFNQDGKADILAKAANGDLFFYPGNGKGGFGKSTKAGWAWGPYDIIPAGDVTGDGIADVLAIDAQGVLYYYAGDGKGGFTGKLTRNGQGWTNIDLYPAGDLNGDGNADILSIRKDGTLHTHLGRGDGGFSKSTQSGKGWAGYELFAGADINKDGRADLISRNTKGELFFYAGKEDGFRASLKVGSGW